MNIIYKLKYKRLSYLLLIFVVSLTFLFRAFALSHLLPSQMDEGSFLTKGYLFVSGKYKLFQDFGPWTNNMPLAYLIPGIPQVLFGPSLIIGRYFAILTSSITLVGLWIITNRLRGKWWALIAVSILAINPYWITINVQAFSQVTVSCLITWMLVLMIGEKRSILQLGAAAFLAVLASLTRQNMVFLLPFIIIYAWWIYGFKAAMVTLLCISIPFFVVHLIYFPKIMNLWYPWIPNSIISLLNVKLDAIGTQVWRPEGDIIDRLTSFFFTIRYYFVPLIGFCFSIPLIFCKAHWRSTREWKTVISLTLIFILLFSMHAWASLFKNYCIYCFPNYVSFFIPIGLVLSILGMSIIINNKHKLSLFFVSLILTIFIPGVFFGSNSTVGRWIIKFPVPRIKNLQILSGSTTLWELIRNRFSATYSELLLILPPIIGLLLLFFLIFILIIAVSIINKKALKNSGRYLAIIFLCFGFLFTPTDLFGNYPIDNTCDGDKLLSQEIAGDQLASQISKDAKVYWGSDSYITPLLYLANSNIQPLQLNGVYAKRIGGDRVTLEKRGFYNKESQINWREEADIILLKSEDISEGWKNYLHSSEFEELETTIPVDPCDPGSSIHIYQRK